MTFISCPLKILATHCSALQPTATHCNTPTATHATQCNIPSSNSFHTLLTLILLLIAPAQVTYHSTNGVIPYFLILPVVNSQLLRLLSTHILVDKSRAVNFISKWVKYCTSGSYYWTHFVSVKHNIYFLLHACSATVRLLHSWVDCTWMECTLIQYASMN